MLHRLGLYGSLFVASAGMTWGDAASHDMDDQFALEVAKMLPKARIERAAPATPAQATTQGQWGNVINWTPHIPVSAAVLPDGRLLTFASNLPTAFPVGPEFTYAAVWTPSTGQFQVVNHPSHDMFCGALVHLPDGRVMVAGGRNNTVRASVFDWRTNAWTRLPDMNGGRWYNTALATGDGQVFTVTGSGTGQNTAEKWTGSAWSRLPGIPWDQVVAEPGYVVNWHPFLSLAPDGRILHFGPTDIMRWLNYQGNGSMANTGTNVPGTHFPKEGIFAMYDEGRVLVAGGSTNTTPNANDSSTGTSATTAYTVDFRTGTPVVAGTAGMANARQFANSVVLPSGEVLVMGGNTSGWKFNDTGSVLPCEIWSPLTGTWRTVASISVPRNYHSVALLLPDGRVYLGGGGLGGADHQDAQLFTPPALFTTGGAAATRPTLNTAPTSISYGAKFNVAGSTDIVQFALVKMASVTHSINTDQRRLVLSYTEPTPGNYELTAHSNANVLTPGHWMLFGLNATGAYSVAKVIRVDAATAPTITNPGPQTHPTNVALSLAINASAANGVTKTHSAAGLPTGLSIQSNTGVISGTPTAAGNFSPTITVTANGVSSSTSFAWSILPNSGSGRLHHEWWLNLPGSSLAELTSASVYPASPTRTEAITTFETASNAADNLGRRVRGWIRPTVTGNYIFHLATDDEGRLLLSTDANSANAVIVARVPSWALPREWNKFPEQTSVAISLTAGKAYYIEALMKEGGGGDNLAVGWTPPGTTAPVVIPSSALTLNPTTNSPPAITGPGSQTHATGATVSLPLSASDPEGQPLTWSASGLPAGLTINATTGVISGSPTTVAVSTVAVSVSDGVNPAVSTSFTWTINGNLTANITNRGPVAAGSSVSFSSNGAGGNGLQYSYAWGDGTTDSAFTTTATANHTFTSAGRYRVVVTVRDSTGRTATAQYYQAIHAPLTARRPSRSSSILFEDRATGNDRIWAVNPDNNSVSVFDATTRNRLAEVTVGDKPRSLALAPDGRVWVVNHRSASISILTTLTPRVATTISLPRASQPFGLAFDPDGSDAWVACEGTGSLLRLNPSTGATLGSLAVGLHARHVAVSPDSARVYVSRFITPALPGESTASVTTTGVGGQVLSVLTSTLTTEKTILLQHSNTPDSQSSGRGIPNYLGAAAISPDGLSLWIPSKQDNVRRGQLRDGQQLTHDLSVRSISSRISITGGTAAATDELTQRVDHDNAGIATAMTFDNFGNYAFTALEGSRNIAVVDAWNRRELLRFDAGRAPQGLTTSPDGRTLYVHNFMDRSITEHSIGSVVDGLETAPTLVSTLQCVSSDRLSTTVLAGKKLFYDAKDPRISFQEYISCASCHEDGGEDGRVWDFTGLGEGLRNTISLRGRSGMAHGPLHWTGNFDEVQDFENQIRTLGRGTGLIAGATPHAPLSTANAGRSADLDALAAYVTSLATDDASPLRNADGSLTASAIAGKAVFVSKNCASCHSGNAFTNSALNVLRDIGTLKTTSGKRLGANLTGLDVPTLRGLWNSPPYLHDGSAATITAAIAAHSSVTLTTQESTDLTAYLRQIDGDEPTAPAPVTVTNGLKGEYFNGRTFNTPVLTRIDAKVEFDWPTSPAPGVNADDFSVRWTGEIVAPYSEDFTIYLPADNGHRLTINGTRVIDKWNPADGFDGGWSNTVVRFTAGQRVPIQIDFYESYGGAGIIMYWFSASQGWQVVPSSSLFTGSAGPDVTKPGVTLGTTATGTIRSPFNVTASFTEPVTGLSEADFVLSNGTVTNLQGTGANYTVTVTPGTATSATLSLPAAAAADGAGNTSTASNSLSFIYGQNRAPTVSLATQSAARGLSVNVTPAASDPDGDTLSYSSTGLPPGLSINASTGLISGVVGSAAAASYASSITVRDPGGLTASVNVTWNISTASPGLQATYFNGRNFNTPVLTRVDSGVNFSWDAGSPAPGVDVDNFSVRWSGTILPAFSETYTFVVAGDNGVRVRINNSLIIDQFGDNVSGWFNATVPLVANTPASISIDYKEEYGGAAITIYWFSASQGWETLPTARLQPGSGSSPAGLPQLSIQEIESLAASVQKTLRIVPLPGSSGCDVFYTIPDAQLPAAYLLEYSPDLSNWQPWFNEQERRYTPGEGTAIRATFVPLSVKPRSLFFRVRVE